MIISVPLPPSEGIGYYAWNLSKYLVSKGHTVHILTRGTLAKPEQSIIEGITTWKVPFLPLYPFHVSIHGVFVNRWMQFMHKQLDLLHLHTPLVPLPNSTLPKLVTVHSLVKVDTSPIKVKNIQNLLVKLQAPFSALVEYNVIRRADRIAAVSETIGQELSIYKVGFNKIDILHNGVDISFFSPDRTITIQGNFFNEPYILSVGRLSPPKGIEDLIPCAIKVIQGFPNLKFLIAGSGPQESALRQAINSQGLQNHVILLGHISDREVLYSLYRKAAMFVLPSHHEGLPTVLLEAMACGCPVVSTAVSGAVEIISNGVNGLLVPPKQPDALAKAILQLLHDPLLSRNLGISASKTIEAKFSWETIGENYISAYNSILSARGVNAAG